MLDATVDIYKNGVESELVRWPPFTQHGMRFAPFRMQVQSRSHFQFNFRKIFLVAGSNMDGWKE
jgi:hypothetical protein